MTDITSEIISKIRIYWVPDFLMENSTNKIVYDKIFLVILQKNIVILIYKLHYNGYFAY